jgi:ParB/RepB/Spo0J family partition protein
MERMMRTLKTIPLDKIDLEDTQFLITFLPDLESLVASVQRVGLLEPLLVRKRDDGRYQLICGFKRAEALRLIAVPEVEAFVYPQGALDDIQALLLQMGHNIVRPLNLVEKAQALGKLLAFGCPEREVIDRYLSLLGLQPSIRILKQVTGLMGLEQGLQEYLVRKNLSLSTSTLFLHLDKEGQATILPLLEALGPGENRVKEIISFLREISLRDGVSIASLISKKEIGELIDDQETSRPQRLEHLRRVLKEMRFPRLTAMENTFADYERSLSLPPQISFHPPPFFEGEQFKMELRFKDLKELGGLLARLRRISEGEHNAKDPLQELSHGR